VRAIARDYPLGAWGRITAPDTGEQVMARNSGSVSFDVGGDVDEGYGPVADAFRRNFDTGQEIGAAVAVYRDGRKVVDLWGGVRDVVTGAPWNEDTIVNVFSTTKGMASLAIAHAASRGLLDYDAAVADYWPEFGQAGKSTITVRQLLGHQAGLAAIRPPLTLNEITDTATLSRRVATQAPEWTPGTRHGYHAATLGWYETELLRHVDPAGRTLGRYFAEDIAEPLEIDFHIGLPESVDRDRVARLKGFSLKDLLWHLNTLPPLFALAQFNPRSLPARAFVVAKGVRNSEEFNSEALRVPEIPSANGTGTARAVAKVYGAAATGAADLGLSSAVRAALEAPAVPPTQGLRDKVLCADMSYSLGVGKPFPNWIFGSSGKAYGWPGAGGSLGFADPDTGIGFGYVMNNMGFHLPSDPRERALRQALFRDVLRVRPQT
jgi:CubicO group peptidase (beta-lactamase class C family)